MVSLAISKAVSIYLVLLFCFSYSFLTLVIVLISAILKAHFSYFSHGYFSWVFYRAFLLSGSVLSNRATLSSENACS